MSAPAFNFNATPAGAFTIPTYGAPAAPGGFTFSAPTASPVPAPYPEVKVEDSTFENDHESEVGSNAPTLNNEQAPSTMSTPKQVVFGSAMPAPLVAPAPLAQQHSTFVSQTTPVPAMQQNFSVPPPVQVPQYQTPQQQFAGFAIPQPVQATPQQPGFAIPAPVSAPMIAPVISTPNPAVHIVERTPLQSLPVIESASAQPAGASRRAHVSQSILELLCGLYGYTPEDALQRARAYAADNGAEVARIYEMNEGFAKLLHASDKEEILEQLFTCSVLSCIADKEGRQVRLGNSSSLSPLFVTALFGQIISGQTSGAKKERAPVMVVGGGRVDMSSACEQIVHGVIDRFLTLKEFASIALRIKTPVNAQTLVPPSVGTLQQAFINTLASFCAKKVSVKELYEQLSQTSSSLAGAPVDVFDAAERLSQCLGPVHATDVLRIGGITNFVSRGTSCMCGKVCAGGCVAKWNGLIAALLPMAPVCTSHAFDNCNNVSGIDVNALGTLSALYLFAYAFSITSPYYVTENGVDIPVTLTQNGFLGPEGRIRDQSQVVKIYDIAPITHHDMQFADEKGIPIPLDNHARGISQMLSNNAQLIQSFCKGIVDCLREIFPSIESFISRGSAADKKGLLKNIVRAQPAQLWILKMIEFTRHISGGNINRTVIVSLCYGSAFLAHMMMNCFFDYKAISADLEAQVPDRAGMTFSDIAKTIASSPRGGFKTDVQIAPSKFEQVYNIKSITKQTTSAAADSAAIALFQNSLIVFGHNMCEPQRATAGKIPEAPIPFRSALDHMEYTLSHLGQRATRAASAPRAGSGTQPSRTALMATGALIATPVVQQPPVIATAQLMNALAPPVPMQQHNFGVPAYTPPSFSGQPVQTPQQPVYNAAMLMGQQQIPPQAAAPAYVPPTYGAPPTTGIPTFPGVDQVKITGASVTSFFPSNTR